MGWCREGVRRASAGWIVTAGSGDAHKTEACIGVPDSTFDGSSGYLPIVALVGTPRCGVRERPSTYLCVFADGAACRPYHEQEETKREIENPLTMSRSTIRKLRLSYLPGATGVGSFGDSMS
jgi:hypothetical protein